MPVVAADLSAEPQIEGEEFRAIDFKVDGLSQPLEPETLAIVDFSFGSHGSKVLIFDRPEVSAFPDAQLTEYYGKKGARGRQQIELIDVLSAVYSVADGLVSVGSIARNQDLDLAAAEAGLGFQTVLKTSGAATVPTYLSFSKVEGAPADIQFAKALIRTAVQDTAFRLGHGAMIVTALPLKISKADQYFEMLRDAFIANSFRPLPGEDGRLRLPSLAPHNFGIWARRT